MLFKRNELFRTKYNADSFTSPWILGIDKETKLFENLVRLVIIWADAIICVSLSSHFGFSIKTS